MRKIINKKHTMIMMAGSLVGHSFMGAKKLLQEADMAVGIIKQTAADKERTKKSANNVGIQYVLDKDSIGELGYTVCKAKNINIGIVLIDKQQKEEDIRQCISDAKSSGAEFILVYVASDIIDDGIGVKKIAEAGADYILGYGKKKVGSYSISMTASGKKVPVIYSLGNLGGKQGSVMILELQLMKNRRGVVEIKHEGYHPCIVDGKITPINDALKTCTGQEERVKLEDALFSIKTSMGINQRCKCYIDTDKALETMVKGKYSALQEKYEVKPVLTAKKSQTNKSVPKNLYSYDETKGCYTRKWHEAEREAVIACVGIIEYSRKYEEDAECFGCYEFRKDFKEVSKHFNDADFVIGNLAVMSSPDYPSISQVSSRTEKQGYRNCRIEFIEALGQAGFNGIAAANIYNAGLGIEGIIDTEKAIKDSNMLPFGIGYEKNSVVDINGIKVGFVSITSSCLDNKNVLTGEAANRFLNVFDINMTKAEIDNVKACGAEVIITYIHCGIEEELLSLEKRKDLAEKTAQIGADYIICTGSKEVSEYYHFETEDGRCVPIATSLGCFITDGDDNADACGAIINVMIRRDFDGTIKIDDNYTELAAAEKIGNHIKKKYKRQIKLKENFTKNFTIAEIYEFLGKEPSEEDLKRFVDKYHSQVSFITAKEDKIQEGCVAVLYGYTSYNEKEEFRWDLEKCVNEGVSLIIDNEPHDELPCIVVEEPLMDVYVKLNNAIINWYDPIKVAITGSMGKTTTKEMTVEVFKKHFKTMTNSGNANTIYNIGLFIQKLQEDDEAYIQEAHGGTIGMASQISHMMEPDICILTNIEKNHMSQVGTLDNLIASKMGIIDGLKKDGVFIICNDNKILHDIKPSVRTIRYSVHDESCHYYARNIRSEGDDLLFEIVANDSEFDHAGVYPARINMQGEHNVGNAIAAFAAGRQAGIPPYKIIAGLSGYRTTGIRQNIIEYNGTKIILDTHNSNPVALKNMLGVFDRYDPDKGGKKVLILGMMGEQGEDTSQIHYDTGKAVCEHDFDLMFCFGEESKHMVRAAKECGKNAYYFENREVFNKMISENISPGDVVMVKGSHAMKLDTDTMIQIFGTAIY